MKVDLIDCPVWSLWGNECEENFPFVGDLGLNFAWHFPLNVRTDKIVTRLHAKKN